ncbi:MAG TPA: SDR family NAD(P)-dependent oxidoreductase [Propionibacteriaceae bacterium]|nr:SDR family NAD(P)-dependent oxidoreductase [Propionibacteriaceae bacterium]
MIIDLRDRVVLVTGAGRGIGRAIAETFAGEGAVVVALDLDGDDLRRLTSGLASTGGTAVAEVADVCDPAAVEGVVARTVERFGRLDVLVNNAGINVEGRLEELDAAAWDRCFSVNVRGTFTTCHAVAPVMKQQRAGRILNAASFAAIVPSVGASAYAASKAAVVQFTRTIAGELGPWGITANSYAPGMIPTAMNGFAELPPAAQAKKLDTLSLRRWGSPQDVAHLLCFLASDLAGYITGTLVDVSGGKLATQDPSAAYAHLD